MLSFGNKLQIFSELQFRTNKNMTIYRSEPDFPNIPLRNVFRSRLWLSLTTTRTQIGLVILTFKFRSRECTYYLSLAWIRSMGWIIPKIFVYFQIKLKIDFQQFVKWKKMDKRKMYLHHRRKITVLISYTPPF